MPKVVQIIINERSFPVACDPAGLDLHAYDFCVITGHDDQPEETGYVHGITCRCEKQVQHTPLPRVLRKANPREIRAWHFLQRRQNEALAICKEKAVRHNLDMRISSVKFDDRQRKVIFNFTADKRVDFRELVKDLASTFHARIELWQIGVRDETRLLGGMGVCGRHLCCASWLKEFIPVSIRYAKVQDIPFSPAKLSGICGRLRCCLAYEQSQYAEMGKNVPPIGATVHTEEHGEAKVIDRNLLVQTLSIQDEKGHTHIIPVSSARQVKDAPDASASETWNALPDDISSVLTDDDTGAALPTPRAEKQREDRKKQQPPREFQRKPFESRKRESTVASTEAALQNPAEPDFGTEEANTAKRGKRRHQRFPQEDRPSGNTPQKNSAQTENTTDNRGNTERDGADRGIHPRSAPKRKNEDAEPGGGEKKKHFRPRDRRNRPPSTDKPNGSNPKGDKE